MSWTDAHIAGICLALEATLATGNTKVFGHVGDLTLINPFNHPVPTISVEEPLSKAGDHVVIRARMNLRVALAACSVTESKCNGGGSTSITAVVTNAPPSSH